MSLLEGRDISKRYKRNGLQVDALRGVSFTLSDGEILGVVLCLVLKYGAGIGLDVNILVFAVIVFAIMLSVQFIDNFVLQPIIYSTSIQSTPLEIFIVLLVSGHVGGILGMLAAIPIYTVIRVVAGRFFYNHKAVRRLMPDLEKDVHEINESIS